MCSFCIAKNIAVIEDEYHVLLICQTYEDLRNHYLGNVLKNLYSFVHIMSCRNIEKTRNVANFLFEVFKCHNSLINIGMPILNIYCY